MCTNSWGSFSKSFFTFHYGHALRSSFPEGWSLGFSPVPASGSGFVSTAFSTPNHGSSESGFASAGDALKSRLRPARSEHTGRRRRAHGGNT